MLWSSTARSEPDDNASIHEVSLFNEPDERLWEDVVTDILHKLKKFDYAAEICPALEVCIEHLRSIPFSIRREFSVGEIFERLRGSFEDRSATRTDLSSHETATMPILVVPTALNWISKKYGVENRPLFSLLQKDSGSVRLSQDIEVQVEAPVFPAGFDVDEEVSLEDESAYLARKFGGLQSTARGVVYVSKLTEHDTLQGLLDLGFDGFYKVNGPYAEHGSKTLLAFRKGQAGATLVYYGFVGEDLMNHKLMQLARFFRSGVAQLKILNSGGLKSWQVASLIVESAIRRLSFQNIDDLIIGYPDVVEEYFLSMGARPLETKELLGSSKDRPFARLKFFEVRLPNGLRRTVAILADIEYRYFGSSIMTLVKPFLARKVDRVIFAGSAGHFDPDVPNHTRIIPRDFRVVQPDGNLGPSIDIVNEAYSLLALGKSAGGRHISERSPLLENPRRVRKWRDEDHATSIDVESGVLAEGIAAHNEAHGESVRFVAVLIKTDTPLALGDKPVTGQGLANPDFTEKEKSKRKYAAEVLGHLFGFGADGTHDPYPSSNHTRLIAQYLVQRITALGNVQTLVNFAVFRATLQRRIDAIMNEARNDRRISAGLITVYRDLSRALETAGVPAQPVDIWDALPRQNTELPRLAKAHQRIMILQSLTRSASISSGVVGYRDVNAAAEIRTREIEGAMRAVDYLMNHVKGSPRRRDLMQMHALANRGVMKDRDLGRIQDFPYRMLDGTELRSGEVFRRLVQKVYEAAATPEAALEAFQDYEQLHPGVDGNGRNAEFLAQSVMLRQGDETHVSGPGHPLLFPNRFDIDYILSLRRNGSFPASNYEFLKKVLQASKKFSEWLTQNVPSSSIERSSIHPRTGLVHIKLRNGRLLIIQQAFLADKIPALEREHRRFYPLATKPEHLEFRLASGTSLRPKSSLVLPHTQYQEVFSLFELSTLEAQEFEMSECDAALLGRGRVRNRILE